MVRFVLVLVMWSCTSQVVCGQILPPFFVAPVTSELQRDLTSPTADTYAIVDANMAVKELKVDTSTLTEAGFEQRLAEMTSRGHLYLVCRFSVQDKYNSQLMSDVSEALKKIATQVGYRRVSAIQMSTSASWEDAIKPVLGYTEGEETGEEVVENDLVRVYPIRTRLSKMLLGDFDCIVEIFRPIDANFTEFRPELREAIIAAVGQAQPQEKRTLLFKLTSTNQGRDRIETLFQSTPRPQLRDAADPFFVQLYQEQLVNFDPSPALLLAEELGFQKFRTSHSPCGGSPEMLVGKRVPNFQLPTVDGLTMELHQEIQGKRALITFWGLACGPCRQEAPHLSRLQEKHGADLVRMIAINGYNDERQKVAEYVAQEGLKQTFVLEGKKVSDELFGVGAYPTTFWVDDEGIVVDYEVGFFSPARLERKLAEWLK